MTQTSIEVFLRAKPVPTPTQSLNILEQESKAIFRVPKDLTLGPVNNQRELLDFAFSGVFPISVQQERVFDKVARKIVLSALDGVNGTVFAYGQTGSGKTFTMTGGAERYEDRGLIPRSISLVFSELAQRTDGSYSVHISCVQIHNEAAYDLLHAPGGTVRSMEDLQRVYMLEDGDNNVHLRDLSVHRANTEEEALNLLFIGDTNRETSETPMNLASSRSHCLFVVTIEARKAGSDLVRRAKLNLVDLAGSERVSRTNSDGVLLREAKYINLSLHYLEQVIIALQEKSGGGTRSHVPYRNSMLTAMLKDSLGGNCATVMLATISSEHSQLEESIATCRFAQRVAMITNEVAVNEEMDPMAVIERLTLENVSLKNELRLLRGEEEEFELGPEALQVLRKRIDAFVADPKAELGFPLNSMQTVHWVISDLRARICKNRVLCARAASPQMPQTQTNGIQAQNGVSSARQTGDGRSSDADGAAGNATADHATTEQQRKLFQEKCAEAKVLAVAIQKHKQDIDRLKQSARESSREAAHDDGSQAASVKQQIEEATSSYKAAFNALRDLKPQIEQLQALLSRQAAAATAAQPGASSAQAATQAYLPVPQPIDSRNQYTALPATADRLQTGTATVSSADASSAPQSPAAGQQLMQRDVLAGTATHQQVVHEGEAAQPSSPVAASNSQEHLPAHATSPAAVGAASFRSPVGAAGLLQQHAAGRHVPTTPAWQPLSEMMRERAPAHMSRFANAAKPPPQPLEDLSDVDPEVMAMAGPLLTGNAIADRNIIRFYEARMQALKRKQQTS